MNQKTEKLDRLAPALASDSITSTELAELAIMPTATNGIVASMYSGKTLGANLGLKEMVLELNSQVEAAQHGDKRQLESLLLSQATTLNAIFAELARRAALNMNSSIPATEAYMRMALRAQNQSRATIETLSAVKSPSVFVAKQANITTGPQQVNNVLFTSSVSGSAIQPNQLSGEADVLRQNP